MWHYRVKEEIWGQNGKMEDVLTIQGQKVKIPLQSPGKLGIFPVLFLFFYLSLPKIWQVYPHKNYTFRINEDKSNNSQSLGFLSWKLWTREAFEIGWFLTTFLLEIEKQNLVVEWLSWLPCKRDFINSTILETWRDIPNTLPRLKLVQQRVHELVGGPLNPPLDNVVGSKRLRSGRVKRNDPPPLQKNKNVSVLKLTVTFTSLIQM